MLKENWYCTYRSIALRYATSSWPSTSSLNCCNRPCTDPKNEKRQPPPGPPDLNGSNQRKCKQKRNKDAEKNTNINNSDIMVAKNIKLGSGLGALKFGMTREEVKAALGEPNEIENYKPLEEDEG